MAGKIVRAAKMLWDAFETYVESAKLFSLFGFLVLAVMLFLMGFFTYEVAGAGFVRYADVLGGTISLGGDILFAAITLASIFSLAFLSVVVTVVVKLKRTMDDVGFVKLMNRIPKYITKLMAAWIMLGIISFVVGLVFTAMHVPAFVTALAMLLLWAFFVFLPQSIVLKDLDFLDALEDSARYCFKKPLAIALVYGAIFFMLFSLVVMEVLVGYFRLFWLGALLSSTVMFLFVIPYIEVLKANLYVTRYRVTVAGLK
ncbi:MAG: hypothetical protein JW834_01805 [Candidatus Diapherotrites archaeon]|nr:hypothetical protein [Candidatus Diapherotrites archaeon]